MQKTQLIKGSYLKNTKNSKFNNKKMNNLILKWAKDLNTLHQRRSTDDKQAGAKMLHIICH